MKSIFEYNENEIKEISKKFKFENYRASQLYKWIYEKYIIDIKTMYNLNKEYKKFVLDNFKFITMRIIKEYKSKNNNSFKLVLSLSDNKNIEIVIMRYNKNKKNRNTLCISSQIGCKIKCPFCATGQSGFYRNLTYHEILEQFVIANNYLKLNINKNEKINNIVFMGMGEPFLNKKNVFKSIKKLINDFKINERKITISTSGIVPVINEFATLNLKCVLAISLHASNDYLRNELVPINKKYPLEKLIKSCKNYLIKTKQRITFEYIMLNKKNLYKKNIIELKKILNNLKCNINVIVLNKTKQNKYKKAEKNEIDFFCSEMKKNKFLILSRKLMGEDFSGACGQLKILKNKKGLEK